MVGSLFMLMVGVEILWGKVEEKYQEVTGKPQEPEKDPAALVGTLNHSLHGELGTFLDLH